MLRVLIIGEDTAHAALVSGLTRLQVRTTAHERGESWVWDNLPFSMVWLGEQDLSKHLSWEVEQDPDSSERPHRLGVRYTKSSKAISEGQMLPSRVSINDAPVPTQGFVAGEPVGLEGHAWRRALLWAFLQEEPPEVIIAVRDTDGRPELLEGLQRVRTHIPFPGPVLLAAPHRDAEAWFIAGFEPENDDEHTRLRDVVAELSFDPRRAPHRLTSQPNNADTDAKRVLQRLLNGARQSRPIPLEELPTLVERCLNNTQTLAARGEETGIVTFLQQIEEFLYPILSGSHSH